MRFNFRKIASVFASAVMLSSTVGFAAAATYPAPFNTGAAVVYGTGAGVADSDMAQAVSVTSDLKKTAVTAVAADAPTGGEVYEFKKGSKLIYAGGGLHNVTLDLDKGELPTLLADGKYTDDDNDEFHYTQKINLANVGLTLFDDNDYKDNTPTLAARIASGGNVLRYNLSFTDTPLITDMETSDLTFLGKTYYVLDVVNDTSKISLLDASETTVLNEEEEITVEAGGKTYIVSATITASNKAKLTVDGSTTNALAAGQTSKLADGSYVGIKDINYEALDTAVNSVEFAIGSGKVVIESGLEVKINDDAVSGLTGNVKRSGDKVQEISLNWNVDDDSFIATDQELVMPAFGAIKFTYIGMEYPAEETFKITYDGEDSIRLDNFPLKDSTEDINILYSANDGLNWSGIGKDGDNKLATNASVIVFDGDDTDYFIASYKSGDEAESYLMRASTFTTDSSTLGTNKTTIEYRKNGAWEVAKIATEDDNDVEIGDVTFTVGEIDRLGKWINFTAGSGTVFNKLYSKEGLEILLPYANDGAYTVNGINLTAGQGPSTYNITFTEEDKDDAIATSNAFVVRVGFASAKASVTSIVSGFGVSGSGYEIGSSDVYQNYVYSPLNTMISYDTGGDQDSATITYHGGESYGKFYVTSPEATTGVSSVIATIKDTEIESYKSRNLFVVGGSCINSVAAKLLGSETPLCGADFTAKTNVGAGQYIIKSFASPYAAADSGKIAMLAAGYEAADTIAAVTQAMKSTTVTDVDTEVIGPVTA
jgi:hypothetical protein